MCPVGRAVYLTVILGEKKMKKCKTFNVSLNFFKCCSRKGIVNITMIRGFYGGESHQILKEDHFLIDSIY